MTDADLVFDVTIPEVHKQIVMKAVKLGCDVIGEKPMAVNLQDAIEMEQYVRQHNKSYSVMQNRQLAEKIREARGLIDQGVIGRPGQTTANFFLGPHFGGFRDVMDNPLLLDMAIHTLIRRDICFRLILYLCIVMNSILRIPGMREMPRRSAFSSCQMDRYSPTMVHGVGRGSYFVGGKLANRRFQGDINMGWRP